MKLLAFTVTRASTPARIALLQSTITNARKTSGVNFDWLIYNSGCSPDGKKAIELAVSTGQVTLAVHSNENVGQHVAWNFAFTHAVEHAYTHFLRLDDDVEFLSKRWLRKLIDASTTFDDKFCLSPRIRGLKNPPQTSQPCVIQDYEVRFLFDAIGGICRLHPVALFTDFVADVRKPLGSGDATGIAKYCIEHKIPMAYLSSVRVKHAHTTVGQEATDPGHFLTHGVFQHIPYIPVITQ